MANLSNINNKFIVTDGGNVLIGQSNNSSGRLQIKDTQTSSFNDGLAITRNNAAQTGYINMVGGAFNFNSPGLSYKFRNNGTQTLELDSSGKIQVGSDKVIWAGGYGGGLVIRQNNATGDRLIKMVTVDSAGAIANDNVLVAKGASVGIGTASPGSKLEVVGGTSTFSYSDATPAGSASSVYRDAVFGSTDTTNTGITVFGSGQTGISFGDAGSNIRGQVRYQHATDTLELGASGNINMYINSTGNVGIGTTSPSGKLNVFGTTGLPATSGTTFTGTMRLQVAGYGTTLDFGAVGPAVGSQWLQVTDVGNLAITYPLLLQPNGGNVGIGMATPGAKLDVLQVAKVSYANSNQYTLRITNTDGNARILADGSGAHLIFGTTPSGSSFADERMIIQNSGNVGIGTTSPGSKLEVKTSGFNSVIEVDNSDSQYSVIQHNALGVTKGFSGYNSSFMIFGGETGVETRLQANGSYAATILTNGNIGIGTTSPAQKLHLQEAGATSVYTQWSNNSLANNAYMGLTVAGQLIIQNNTSIKFDTGASYTKKLEIAANGTLTSSPAAGAYGIRQNGVSSICNSGYVAGNATLSFTYDAESQGSMFIECVFNHYGFITSYGCARIATVAIGPNIQINDIQYITSGAGGSWTFSRVSNTQFTIAKTAGTYGGGGYYFVNIRGNGVKYT